MPIKQLRKATSDEELVTKIKAWQLQSAGGSLLVSSRKGLDSTKRMAQQQ